MNLRPLAIGCFGVSSALAWLCFTLLAAPISIGEIDAGSPWTPDMSTPVAEARPVIEPEADAAMLDRLLFSPTRRLPGPRPPAPQDENAQAEVAAAPSQPVIDIAPPEGAVLQGVFIDADRRAALITATSHPDGVWLKSGDDLEGWKISRIGAEGIALSSAGREITLTLYAESSQR